MKIKQGDSLLEGGFPVPEFVVEILVCVTAPDRAAVERIAEDVRSAVRRTNFRVRDGRVENVIVSDVRSEDE